MRKISLGVIVLGFVLAWGLCAAAAQAQPPMAGMGGMSGRCADMMGKAMTGRCGGMMGPGMMAGTGRCGCGMMTDKAMMGRHMGMTGGMGMGMAGMRHHIWHYVMGLDLDQKQRAEIWKIRTDMMKNMIRKKADLRIAMLELGELVHADNVDMQKVDAKVKQMEGLRSSMLLSGIEAAESVKSKLTADQRKKLDEMMEGPMRCMMTGDDMSGGSMTDQDMMEEGQSSPGEGNMEEAPAGHD